MARKKTAREKADEKRRFYMYLSYGRQMEMLTDEELGRTMRHVYHYADTGKLRDDKSPLVNMLVSVITTQYDIDKENYVEMIEQNRENASKGGEKSAEIRRAKAEQARPEAQNGEDDEKENEEVSFAEAEHVSFNKAVVQTGTTASRNEPRLKNEPDRETDRETDRLTDRKTEEYNNYYYYCSGKGMGSSEDAQNEYIPYGQEQYLATRAEVKKVEALAAELMHTYRNRKPTPHDCEKVFEYVHTIGITADGENYGIYSDTRAELLRHVFEQAAARSDLNWQYINRIYLNYEKHRVTSVEEAIEYEGKWQRGEIA